MEKKTCNKAKGMAKRFTFTRKQLVGEHERLVKNLKSGNPKKLATEAKEQSEELKSYKK